MQVPTENFKKWQRLYDRGDKTKIAEEKDINPRKVAEAIDEGTASAEDIVKIDEWFNEKESALNAKLK